MKSPVNITVTCDDLFTRVRWEDADGVRYLINCKPETVEVVGTHSSYDRNASKIAAGGGIIVRKWRDADTKMPTIIDGNAKANAAVVQEVLAKAASLLQPAIQAKADKDAADKLAQRRARLNRLTEEMVTCKAVAAELGLVKTVKALDEATKAIGFEIAEVLPR